MNVVVLEEHLQVAVHPQVSQRIFYIGKVGLIHIRADQSTLQAMYNV
jgi:hypothetical protein